MSSIVRAISPEVLEPQPGTWSNCLVVGGVAYWALSAFAKLDRAGFGSHALDSRLV